METAYKRKTQYSDIIKDIEGVVLPCSWEEERISIYTFNQDEFLIDNDEMGRELLALTYEKIKASGEVKILINGITINQKKIIKLIEYTIIS